jgi:hypothetical protein
MLVFFMAAMLRAAALRWQGRRDTCRVVPRPVSRRDPPNASAAHHASHVLRIAAGAFALLGCPNR